MSDFQVRSEEDALPGRRLLFIGGAVVVISVFWVIVAWGLLHAREEALRPGRHFPERDVPGQDVISGIEQTLIEVRDHGAELAAEKRAVLGSFGWVERDQGIVHIPIDQAIDVVAGGGK